MNTTQQQIIDEMSNEQYELFLKIQEQKMYDEPAKDAEFWAAVENMTPAEVIKFHKGQLKAHKRNRDRASYLDTKAKHSREIIILEALLIILEDAN